ncbi:MAG: protein kinase [bacterium]|nr:protein kinase [bacterium]
MGRGGFSRVFSAYQVAFDRRVALKVLNERLADDASVAAFERECQAMGGLSRHPFIVTVLASAFTSDYRPCIVMDLFERGNYMQLVRRDGPLPLEELLSLSVRVAGALATAHQDGVVHGDVKPQNIFKSGFGYPALGDFGIATLRSRVAERAGVGLSPHFVAPELIEMGAGAVGAAADQYSLGATVFTLATGRRPFESAGPRAPQQVLAEALEAPAPVLPETFPRDLRAVLRRAMVREPQDRFPDLGAFAVALANVEHRLGHRPTAIPIAGIDDDATITVDHDTLEALRRQTPAPPPEGPDAPTIALTPPQQPPGEPPGDQQPPQQPKRRRRVLLVALALLAAAGATAGILLTPGEPEPEPPPPTSTTTEPATPEPATPEPATPDPTAPAPEPPPAPPPPEPEPPAPPQVRFFEQDGRLVGSWSIPEGSPPVDTWDVQHHGLSGRPSPTETRYEWDGILPGTYTIEVRACNATGCSPAVAKSASVPSTESASAAPAPPPFIPAATNSTLSAGDIYSCGLRADGTITCWGNNDAGQLEVPAGSFAAVSAGWAHSCGLRADGTITCWGANDAGQLEEVPAGSFVAVSAGGAHSCGLRADGSITCWGWNDYGQLLVPAGSFVAIGAGGLHSCALRTDATIVCWGSNHDLSGNYSGQADAPIL